MAFFDVSAHFDLTIGSGTQFLERRAVTNTRDSIEPRLCYMIPQPFPAFAKIVEMSGEVSDPLIEIFSQVADGLRVFPPTVPDANRMLLLVTERSGWLACEDHPLPNAEFYQAGSCSVQH